MGLIKNENDKLGVLSTNGGISTNFKDFVTLTDDSNMPTEQSNNAFAFVKGASDELKVGNLIPSVNYVIMTSTIDSTNADNILDDDLPSSGLMLCTDVLAL